MRSCQGMSRPAQRLADGLRLRVDVQLLVDAADVVADGVDGDPKAIADVLVAVAVGEHADDARFVRRERLFGLLDGTGHLQGDDDLAGDVGGHRGTALVRFANRLEQARRRRLLQEIPAGAVAERLEDPLLFGEHREHEDLHARVLSSRSSRTPSEPSYQADGYRAAGRRGWWRRNPFKASSTERYVPTQRNPGVPPIRAARPSRVPRSSSTTATASGGVGGHVCSEFGERSSVTSAVVTRACSCASSAPSDRQVHATRWFRRQATTRSVSRAPSRPALRAHAGETVAVRLISTIGRTLVEPAAVILQLGPKLTVRQLDAQRHRFGLSRAARRW